MSKTSARIKCRDRAKLNRRDLSMISVSSHGSIIYCSLVIQEISHMESDNTDKVASFGEAHAKENSARR